MFKVTATLQTRYNFTGQYVGGAALLARRARQIEDTDEPSRLEQAEHKAKVVGAVQQSVAAVEAELNAVAQYGPGHQLGSNGIDHEAREYLEPLAPLIDRASGPLERWANVLHLLKKSALPKGEWPWQDVPLLVDLRNELVHYRSHVGGWTSKGNLLAGLRSKGFKPPPFVPVGANEFPLRTLSADCADWAAITATGFLDATGEALGKPNALDGHRVEGADFESAVPSRGARWSSAS